MPLGMVFISFGITTLSQCYVASLIEVLFQFKSFFFLSFSNRFEVWSGPDNLGSEIPSSLALSHFSSYLNWFSIAYVCFSFKFLLYSCLFLLVIYYCKNSLMIFFNFDNRETKVTLFSINKKYGKENSQKSKKPL